MRLPNIEHTSRPWRVHEFTGDFKLEDVWALQTPGGKDDFPRLVQMMVSFDPRDSSPAVRLLFAIRFKLGALFGWDETDFGNDPNRPTLLDRLPPDLRDTAPEVHLPLPFTPLYMTDDEWAAEIINRTVHGVLHLGWVPDEADGYRGQMAVLVKPNGLLGTGYMAAITPFRYLVVYPGMLRMIQRSWRARARDRSEDAR